MRHGTQYWLKLAVKALDAAQEHLDEVPGRPGEDHLNAPVAEMQTTIDEIIARIEEMIRD